MASAELALAIPSLVLVLAMALLGLALAVDQIRVTDAARTAARAAARGIDTAEVREVATRLAPDGARVSVRVSGADAVVEVLAPPRIDLLPGLPRARASAVMPREPHLSDPP